MKDAVEKPPSTFSCTRRSGKTSDKPDQRVIFVNLLGFGSAPKLDGPDHRYQTCNCSLSPKVPNQNNLTRRNQNLLRFTTSGFCCSR